MQQKNGVSTIKNFSATKKGSQCNIKGSQCNKKRESGQQKKGVSATKKGVSGPYFLGFVLLLSSCYHFMFLIGFVNSSNHSFLKASLRLSPWVLVKNPSYLLNLPLWFFIWDIVQLYKGLPCVFLFSFLAFLFSLLLGFFHLLACFMIAFPSHLLGNILPFLTSFDSAILLRFLLVILPLFSWG